MGTRALGPGAGIGWLKNAVNLGRDNPKAIFGGAALMVLVLVAMVLPLILLFLFARKQILRGVARGGIKG